MLRLSHPTVNLPTVYRAILVAWTAAMAVLVVGCAEVSGVRKANVNGVLPPPSSDFMKKVDRDPFPNATSVPRTSTTKSKSTKPR